MPIAVRIPRPIASDGDARYELYAQNPNAHPSESTWQPAGWVTDIRRLEDRAPLHPDHAREHGPAIAQAASEIGSDKDPLSHRTALTDILLNRSRGHDGDEIDVVVHDAWRQAGRASSDSAAERWLTAMLPDDLRATLDPTGGDRQLIAQAASAARVDDRISRSLEGVRAFPAPTLDRPQSFAIGR